MLWATLGGLGPKPAALLTVMVLRLHCGFPSLPQRPWLINSLMNG